MKKLIALLVAFFLCSSVSFVGCSSNELTADDGFGTTETSAINGGRNSETVVESGNGETADVTEDGSGFLVFSVCSDGETCAVSGIESGKYNVVGIPAEQNGKAVTRILPQAFLGSKIAEIRIPETIIEIGGYAFDGTGLVRAVFERTDGWSAGDKQVVAATLSNVGYAATYLRQTYKGYVWTRK